MQIADVLKFIYDSDIHLVFAFSKQKGSLHTLLA